MSPLGNIFLFRILWDIIFQQGMFQMSPRRRWFSQGNSIRQGIYISMHNTLGRHILEGIRRTHSPRLSQRLHYMCLVGTDKKFLRHNSCWLHNLPQMKRLCLLYISSHLHRPQIKSLHWFHEVDTWRSKDIENILLLLLDLELYSTYLQGMAMVNKLKQCEDLRQMFEFSQDNSGLKGNLSAL